MSKTRNLSDLLDANGDVKSTALDNVPASNDASALTTGTLDSARLGTITNFTSTGIDDNATSTAVTLDSSGNVLVGATSTTGIANGSSVNEGNAIIQSGGIAAQRNNDSPLYLSKASGYTYDGFARFFHNGTEVGKIGFHDNDLVIGTGDTGLKFNDAANAWVPWNTSTNSAVNGTIDIGGSTVGIKDIYTTGSIYLGGTGSANAFDDYEEGTWTPTVGSGTISSANTIYTKVGNKVTVSGRVQNFSDRSSSSAVLIQNLPFTSKANTFAVSAVMHRDINSTLNRDSLVAYVDGGQSQFELYMCGNQDPWNLLQHNEIGAASCEIYFHITYTTN